MIKEKKLIDLESDLDPRIAKYFPMIEEIAENISLAIFYEIFTKIFDEKAAKKRDILDCFCIFLSMLNVKVLGYLYHRLDGFYMTEMIACLFKTITENVEFIISKVDTNLDKSLH